MDTSTTVGRSRAARRSIRMPSIDLTRLGVALLAGALAGLLVGGIGARLAMRVVALLGEGQPSFTIGGTLGILILGAVLGMVGGLGFAVVRGVLRGLVGKKASPLADVVSGALYGAALSALAMLPFFLAPGGELALAPPLVGAALFGWIPLAYGLALGLVVPRIERRTAATQRRVGLGWLAVFGLSLLLALAGMAPLLGEFVPFPLVATQLYGDLGLTFQSAHNLHRWLVLAFMLIYCGLAGLVFWRGSQSSTARLASVTLLLLAAGFFGREPAPAGGMSALPLVGLLVGHSFGGINMLVWAHRYPDEAAGLVLVDSSHPEMWVRVKQIPGPQTVGRGYRFFVALGRIGLLRLVGPLVISQLLGESKKTLPAGDLASLEAFARQTKEYATAVRETDAAAVSFAQAKSALGSLGDLPLAVLTADWWVTGKKSGLKQGSSALRQDMLTWSSCSREVIVEGCSHANLPVVRPDAVAEAVNWVIEQ